MAHLTRAGARVLAWSVAAALALGVGAWFKAYVATLAVAVVLVLLGYLARPLLAGSLRDDPAARRRAGRALVATLLASAVLVGTVSGLDHLAQRHTGITRARLAEVGPPFPPEHFRAMGTWDSQEGSPVRRWGGYRQAQVDATAALTPDEQGPVLRAQVRDQVLERGWLGNLRFFGAKAVWVWGDGTFWAHGEGADGRQPSQLEERWAGLTSWTRGAGEHYVLRGSVAQGVWLALLLSAGGGR